MAKHANRLVKRTTSEKQASVNHGYNVLRLSCLLCGSVPES